jgi:ABC-type transport system involved in cytochrome c biogenesis permease component
MILATQDLAFISASVTYLRLHTPRRELTLSIKKMPEAQPKKIAIQSAAKKS